MSSEPVTQPLADPARPDADLKSREEFLKLMSHEIRTPLNGVLGMLGLLSRTRLDPAQKSYVSAAWESGEHLLSLVNALLDFAKIEAGKLDLDQSPVDLSLVFSNICEVLSPRAHDKNIEICWTVDPAIGRILSDEGRLKQILFNLAGNAVKFVESGGVRLSVEIAGTEGDKIRLRFSVRDTGPGVPLEAQTRIFEQFAHADVAHASRYGGAGLGLAVVKRLAEAFGGAVSVDSTPGQGATFVFEAAFRQVAAEAPPAPALQNVRTAVVTPSTILRDAARDSLTGLGATISGLSSADVVIIDHAGGKSAPMARPDSKPSLILLRPEERDLIPGYRSAGFAGYLIKPLRPASLALRVLAAQGREARAETPMADDDRIAPAAAAGLRVLLVEDNPVNALLAKALLTREGCLVERAASGTDALASITAGGDFDVVLTDMRMPGLDGPGLARTLRARGYAGAIIALTANAFADDRDACLSSGMDDFLTKPIDPQALRNSLVRWGVTGRVAA